MMATDTKATCWICYGDADLALDDDSDRWVKPCKCKGTLALVHEQCLLGYIASKHNDDEPTPCPNCGVNYVMQDTSSPVIRFFEALDGWLKRLAPFYVFYVVLSFLLTPEYFEMVMPASLSHWAWVTPKLQTAVYTVMTVSALRIFSIPMLVSTFLGGPKATTDPVHVPFAEIGFWPPSMAMAFVTIPLFMLFCNFAYTKAVEVYLLPKAIASNELLHTLRGADGKPSDEYENELDRTRVVLGIPDSPHRLNKWYALFTVFILLMSIGIEFRSTRMFASLSPRQALDVALNHIVCLVTGALKILYRGHKLDSERIKRVVPYKEPLSL